MRQKSYKLIIVWGMSIISALSACQNPPDIWLEGGALPTFIMSDLKILSLKVYDTNYHVKLSNVDDYKPTLLWEIKSADDTGEDTANVRHIQYGVTPQGYTQLFPGPGQTPSPLVEGHTYRIFVRGSRQTLERTFIIEGGRAVFDIME